MRGLIVFLYTMLHRPCSYEGTSLYANLCISWQPWQPCSYEVTPLMKSLLCISWQPWSYEVPSRYPSLCISCIPWKPKEVPSDCLRILTLLFTDLCERNLLSKCQKWIQEVGGMETRGKNSSVKWKLIMIKQTHNILVEDCFHFFAFIYNKKSN